MYSVILVDDQPLCLRGMETGFQWKKNGFEVVFKTTNQQVALEMIAQLNPDVVCTDMRMPQISGIELMKAARIMNVKAKFIIVSGYRDFEAACEAVRYNAFWYCLKPIDIEKTDEILEKLRNVLDSEQNGTVSEHVKSEFVGEDLDNFAIPNAKFRKMVKYINEHYREDLNLEDLAEMFDINASFASRLFSQHFNMGYTKYLSQLRMVRAQRLLRETDVSIEEISYAVGFKDQAYFCRVFKKYCGETPYAYRWGYRK